MALNYRKLHFLAGKGNWRPQSQALWQSPLFKEAKVKILSSEPSQEHEEQHILRQYVNNQCKTKQHPKPTQPTLDHVMWEKEKGRVCNLTSRIPECKTKWSIRLWYGSCCCGIMGNEAETIKIIKRVRIYYTCIANYISSVPFCFYSSALKMAHLPRTVIHFIFFLHSC